MADNSQKMSYHAGEAKGQAQEKASNLMDRASNAAQSAKESVQEAGEQVRAKAQGAVEGGSNRVILRNGDEAGACKRHLSQTHCPSWTRIPNLEKFSQPAS
ncbi:unnamed protein product, partial [Dovyalis caffra]